MYLKVLLCGTGHIEHAKLKKLLNNASLYVIEKSSILDDLGPSPLLHPGNVIFSYN